MKFINIIGQLRYCSVSDGFNLTYHAKGNVKKKAIHVKFCFAIEVEKKEGGVSFAPEKPPICCDVAASEMEKKSNNKEPSPRV